MEDKMNKFLAISFYAILIGIFVSPSYFKAEAATCQSLYTDATTLKNAEAQTAKGQSAKIEAKSKTINATNEAACMENACNEPNALYARWVDYSNKEKPISTQPCKKS